MFILLSEEGLCSNRVQSKSRRAGSTWKVGMDGQSAAPTANDAGNQKAQKYRLERQCGRVILRQSILDRLSPCPRMCIEEKCSVSSMWYLSIASSFREEGAVDDLA